MKYNIAIRYLDDTIDINFSHESDSDVDKVLEEIFGQWNNGSSRESDLFLSSKVRSMMVGDFVQVENQWFKCASFGWDKVTKGEVVIWFHELFKLRDARAAGSTPEIERQLRWLETRGMTRRNRSA
jgi:hypothetical protein